MGGSSGFTSIAWNVKYVMMHYVFRPSLGTIKGEGIGIAKSWLVFQPVGRNFHLDRMDGDLNLGENSFPWAGKPTMTCSKT